MLYDFFWVIPGRLKFICRRFGTLCLFHLHRQVGESKTPTSPSYRQTKAMLPLFSTLWTTNKWSPPFLRIHHIEDWPGILLIRQTLLPAYEDGTECSETSAYKIQTLGNYPEEIIQITNYRILEGNQTVLVQNINRWIWFQEKRLKVTESSQENEFYSVFHLSPQIIPGPFRNRRFQFPHETKHKRK
jgi:hypothetical protein